MFCLRSWLPLLFIPTNASPAFIFLFFICTYFLNRPCVYCSILLLVLFFTSCNWSDRCFFDFSSEFFRPRSASLTTTAATDAADIYALTNSTIVDIANTTARALASAAVDAVREKRAEWTGIGAEWLRSLLGRREWGIECLDIKIHL